ncbi:glutathione S-transferase family protein [Tropicimonas sediminicola]|uniref:Glutathione S-transferase n=1 Tax=Tropicimonas sediminicola TaxID=1031541 RepID=A0A239F9X9_9RHOB|nr:glutathione S-transferase family protein [Tropicimonas sediminicola]SNS53716.1 glutathione S-transferase [Tropicimonas sediminicola]
MPEIEPKDRSLKALKGLHLWHAPMSSCSQRVRIVIEETGRAWESHPIDLEKDEHATEAYQAIHPKGLVPALVDDGRLMIESIDIIQHVAGQGSELLENAEADLLERANAAQADLKLLTFEFLFRAGPPPSTEQVAAFEDGHRNDWLKQFRRDFAQGFGRERIDAAVRRTAEGFRHLDALLADGRPFLSGETFSLSDVAWMPNVHRFALMGWPFEQTPRLQDWFDRVSRRPSYGAALLAWQNEEVAGVFAEYTRTRRAEGTDIRTYGGLQS